MASPILVCSWVGQVSLTLSKNDQRWGVLNLLRRLLAAEWEMAEQVRDSRATQWGTVPSKGHFSTKSSLPASASIDRAENHRDTESTEKKIKKLCVLRASVVKT
jgi:hypothetical protein